MKKLTLLLLTAMVTTNAFADSISTSDGISCSFDADAAPVTVSPYIEMSDADDHNRSDYGYGYNSRDDDRIGVRVELKFGVPDRLECKKLYDLELREKNAKIAKMEAQLKALEALKNLKVD